MSGAGAGRVVWLTGLPASGKTTIARQVVHALRARGVAHLWLDSDDLRAVLTPSATYGADDRDRFYAALAHLARLGADGGVTVVVSATAPLCRYRDRVRAEVPRFSEVYVTAPDALLRARDPKELYLRAARGEVTTLPGVGAPYEAPERPELVLDTAVLTVEEAARWVLALATSEAQSSSAVSAK